MRLLIVPLDDALYSHYAEKNYIMRYLVEIRQFLQSKS